MFLQNELWVIANVCLVGTMQYVKEQNFSVGMRISDEISTGKMSPIPC
ncbi:hypothetical protein SAMN05660816_01214 [Niastella yeongjuensis]|nr:hypothetical protein SAMN05660816_01214 [Niastella yeongjuensis]